MVQNKAVIFKCVPSGIPLPGKDLVIEAGDFELDQTAPAGAITTKNIYASLDPYMRPRMPAPELKSYKAPSTLGQPITAHSIAKVLKSEHPLFRADDLIRANYLAIEEYSVLSRDYVDDKVVHLENPFELDPAEFIGALGSPGLTAYSSFYEIGKPRKGETIFIFAASGAVGQIVGQLAKHEGLTAIGSVGSGEKLDFILHDMGFDAGFNYKEETPADALKRLAPDGIDIYFENVGGVHLEAAIDAMNDHGRIIACGMISEYSVPAARRYGVKNLLLLITKRLTMRGFIVGDTHMGPAYAKEHNENMSRWIHEGKIKTKMSITHGIDDAAVGFVGMLEGNNLGKSVLRYADTDE